jgi:hypothetical protein
MRRNRIKVRKNFKKKNLLILILFLLILPLTAVYIGLRITERWVMPALYSDYIINDELLENSIIQNENNEEQNDLGENGNALLEVGEIQPITIFMIQVASVSSTESIESLIGELNQNNLSHIVYKTDNIYKVYTLGLTERNIAEEKLVEIRLLYPDAFISEVRIPSKKLSYSKSGDSSVENFIAIFNNLIQVMNQQAEEWNRFYKGEEPLQYAELLNKHQEVLVQLTENMESSSLPEEFTSKNIWKK